MTVSEISQVEIAHVRKGMTGKEKQVVFAASLGTIFDVYDFFLMGLLANEIARNFFSGVNPTAGFIFTLLGWAAGFLLRPFGALVFGRLGDLVGRKYTFLVTIVLMGGATCIIGLLPGYSSIGIGAPIVLITLRMLQGIAFGGEFGGAMIYVAEHAPNEQRGAWTAWIISTAALGFLLAFAVITPARYLIGDTDFMAWGWRVPFLLSSILLAFSLWIRLKLDETPEYKKMKEQGAGSKAPISETFGHWKHLKPVLIALFGIVPGQAVVWYTGQFYTLFFLTRVLKVDASAANQLLVSATVQTAPLYALRVVTAKGTQFTCGDGSGNPVVVRFRTASAERRLLFDPELKLGEVFMDGSLVVERGTIADLLAIAMDHPDATPAWTKPQQWLRYLTRQFRQFNPRGRSRNNVARLCCCSLRRLAAPTSTHTNEHKRTHEPGFRPALGPHTSQRAKSGKHGRILDADRPLIGVQPKVVSGLRALIPIQEKTGQECHAAVLMMSMQQFN